MLGLASSAVAAPDYKLFETWQGKNFLDYFNFHTGSDPTNGFVTYLDDQAAKDAGLVKFTDSGSIYLGVDHKTKLSPSGPGRDSVRIGTKKYYGESLIVADIAHMPGAACGTWPAFWSTGQNWPGDGEIDIIEGVNLQDHNEIVMHTAGTCSITDEGMTGAVNATGCGEDLGTVGCVIEGHEGSYGTSFNKQGGGVYAMEWTPKYLKIWFFPRHSIPDSISKGKPDVTEFGMPMALVQDECDVAKSFKAQSFVFDVTFCGDWAGGVFSESGCPLSSPDSFQSCTDYVANHPAAFKETYWEINYIKMYQTGVKEIENPTSSQTTVSETSTTHPTATHAPETTEVVETSTSHAPAAEATATCDAPTHESESTAVAETSASHAPASEASATSVPSPEGWRAVGPAITTQGDSPAGTVAPVDGATSQSSEIAPPSGSIPTTTGQKPSTTRYVTRLVTSTTALCSQGEGAAPSAHESYAAPATTQATTANQKASVAETSTEQQSTSQAKAVTTPAAAYITEAANPSEPSTEASVDTASNEGSEAKALPTVIPGSGYNLGSASMVPSGHALRSSKPVIPTATRSSAASGSVFAGPSGTGAGAGPVFTGAADKLSAGLSTIAVAFAVVMMA